jgi:serine/threonine protein phosphatase PrpC
MVTYKIISRNGSRPVNEDSTGMHQIDEKYGFFLADGLGGHGKGDVASQTAIEQAILQFEQGNCSEETLKNIFEAGQAAVLEQQRMAGNMQGMKTTMTALLIDSQTIRWGHIGDSRIYFFQNNKLVARTMDHSVPQMLAAIGEIKEKEIRHHPDRNRLLRVMGADAETFRYQLEEPIVRKGRQAFLLCSDGFWELIDEKEMTTLLKKTKTVEQWLDEMEVLVRRHGYGTNMDNYSAVAVWVDI